MKKIAKRARARLVDADTAKGVTNALHFAYDNLLEAHDERMRRLIEEMDAFIGSKQGEPKQ